MGEGGSVAYRWVREEMWYGKIREEVWYGRVREEV